MTIADDYTPSLADGQSYYVSGRAQIRRQVTGEHAQDITPYSYEFDRMIAQVRVEERERAAQIAETFIPDGWGAVVVRHQIAARIREQEKEAGI